MKRFAGTSRKLYIVSAAFFFTAACLPFPAFSSEKSLSPDTLIQRIERQRFSWYGFRAQVEMNFLTSYGQAASCTGNLNYLRLSEEMLLECFNGSGKLLFIFKTAEMDFELYLPYQKELYRGNIFDLEDPDSVNSHIKPFDLYRAFKPMPLAPERTRSEPAADGLWTLYVSGDHQGRPFEQRRILANAAGDVFSEIYLTPQGKEAVAIYREDFRKIYSQSVRDEIIFPRSILIDSGDGSTTEIVFQAVGFLWPPLEGNWVLNYPPDTKITVFPPIPASARQEYFNY